jgi:hypothetical protein
MPLAGGIATGASHHPADPNTCSQLWCSCCSRTSCGRPNSDWHCRPAAAPRRQREQLASLRTETHTTHDGGSPAWATGGPGGNRCSSTARGRPRTSRRTAMRSSGVGARCIVEAEAARTHARPTQPRTGTPLAWGCTHHARGSPGGSRCLFAQLPQAPTHPHRALPLPWPPVRPPPLVQTAAPATRRGSGRFRPSLPPPSAPPPPPPPSPSLPPRLQRGSAAAWHWAALLRLQ